ncbi:MAG: type IV pilus assembly protein PilM [Pseudomonadota bacterium]
MAQQLGDILIKAKDFLGLGDQTILGVDIGLSAVKIAQVEHLKNGNFRLVRWGAVQLPEAAIIEEEIQKQEEIIEAIKQALSRGRMNAEMAAISLSGPNTIARKLQLSASTPEELADNVEWEAEQYIPFDVDDALIAYHSYGENQGGGMDVLVAAARQDVVNNFKNLVEGTKKLRVKIVDLSMISVTNVFEYAMEKQLANNQASYLILDVGAQKTDCVIFKKGMIHFTKRMGLGGSTITEEIQRQMGVNFFQAEDLKVTKDKNGNLPEEVVEVIESVLDQFFSEIKKTLDFYVTATSDEDFAGCWLTGGGCLTIGLKEGLENLLGINVNIFNPFERIEVDKKYISDDELQKIMCTGVTAIGLAMRKSKR